MEYYLGVDIGTTSAKAVAFSLSGEVIASFSCGYKMYHPQPSWSEQDPEEVFLATISSCNQVISSLKFPPRFLSFSSALHGLMLMDKEGDPLTNFIIWADNRASEIADRLKDSEQGIVFYQSTGVPVHAMSPLCKLIWFKENEPAIFKKAHKFIGIKEYLYYKLFDDYLVDTSVASATGLLNTKTLSWDEPVLSFLDITSSFLSRVVPVNYKILSRQKSSAINNVLHIPDGTPLIIGASDGALANLGCGAIDSNSMAISIGTSGAARVVVDGTETDSRMRTFCYHVKDNQYIIGGASNNGAVVLEWLKDKLLESTETFSDFFLRAEKINPGSDDLLFLPYILGERAPVWNSNARGVFFGLNINHTKSHMIRACMEGVIYAMYSIARILQEKKVITEIHATGGFVQSSLWLQILADVCNIKVLVSGAVESSALGAVMIGLEALDIDPFPPKEILASYAPDLLNNELYMKAFEKFELVYESVKNQFINEKSLLSAVQVG